MSNDNDMKETKSLLPLTVWTVWTRGGDATDLDEEATFTSDVANVYWFENGVVIETEPTGFGDYNAQRVVPWSQVIDFRKEVRRG